MCLKLCAVPPIMGPVVSMISSAMLMQVQTFERGKGIGSEGIHREEVEMNEGWKFCLLKTGKRL